MCIIPVTASRREAPPSVPPAQGLQGLQHVVDRQAVRYAGAWQAVQGSVAAGTAAPGGGDDAAPGLGDVRLGAQLGVLTREGTAGVKEVSTHCTHACAIACTLMRARMQARMHARTQRDVSCHSALRAVGV